MRREDKFNQTVFSFLIKLLVSLLQSLCHTRLDQTIVLSVLEQMSIPSFIIVMLSLISCKVFVVLCPQDWTLGDGTVQVQ